MEPSLDELLAGGFQLMVVGMSVVFLFLALLVGAISLLPRLVQRLAGEEAFEQTVLSLHSASTVEPDVLEAIRTAIQLYENNG